MVIVYGISNCDTVKKARAWLAAQGIAYDFHDFKKLGVPPNKVLVWADLVGWDRLLNRQGSTWRKLDAAAQASGQTTAGAVALVMANPSVIKRPVVEWGAGALEVVAARNATPQVVTVGFDDKRWTELTAGVSPVSFPCVKP